MSAEESIRVYVRSTEHDPKNPFAGDLFARRKLGNRLTGLVERISEGCVLAIDAPWGEGKTWFGKNWAADMRSNGISVAYIDAFRQDYVEDPFLMICAEILAETQGTDAKARIADAAKNVAKALIPATAKAMINLGGRVLLGAADLSGDLAKAAEEFDKGLADATEKRLAKRLDEHLSDRRNVDSFAAVLGEHAAHLEKKPLVVIVDELDRCRPDFAVRTIERIKHFFDVPHVVFVLLLNRAQLEAAVRGIYGADVDAKSYLGKFVQFWLRLPKVHSLDHPGRDHNQQFAARVAQRFGLDGKRGHEGFRDMFASLATMHGLSLRDIERGFTLFALGQPMDSIGAFAAWPVFLKIAYPTVFNGLLRDSRNSHDECRKIIKSLGDSKAKWVLDVLSELHAAHMDGFKQKITDATLNVLSGIGTWAVRADRFIPWLCSRIDFDVEE